MKIKNNKDHNNKSKGKINSKQKLKSTKNIKKILSKNGKSKIAEGKLKSGKKLNLASTNQFKGKHFIFDEFDADNMKTVILKDVNRVILKKH